jgi:hypothetical protein
MECIGHATRPIILLDFYKKSILLYHVCISIGTASVSASDASAHPPAPRRNPIETIEKEEGK